MDNISYPKDKCQPSASLSATTRKRRNVPAYPYILRVLEGIEALKPPHETPKTEVRRAEKRARAARWLLAWEGNSGGIEDRDGTAAPCQVVQSAGSLQIYFPPLFPLFSPPFALRSQGGAAERCLANCETEPPGPGEAPYGDLREGGPTHRPARGSWRGFGGFSRIMGCLGCVSAPHGAPWGWS
jgi:hypothetical protein